MFVEDTSQPIKTKFMADVFDDRVVSEGYKLWKKNNPFLYDCMIARILEYPSPSVQWFKELEKADLDQCVVQRLLFGTITGSQEENYLVVSSIILPEYVDEEPINIYTMREEAFGSFFYYNDQMEIDFKLDHNGPVTGAKYMPTRSNIIASKSNTDLFIYDVKDCFEDSKNAEFTQPIHYYQNLNSRIDFDWNPTAEGLLLTSFDSNKMTVWDVQSQKKKKMQPKVVLKFKSESLNSTSDEVFLYDNSWHQKHPDVIGATSSTGEILIYDIRSRNTDQPSHRYWGHKGSAFQIKFNPFSEYVFITSGSDSQICVWDLRNLKVKLHSVKMKVENFSLLKWSPHCETLFAATTNDRKIYLFDLDRILEDQLTEEAALGPSTLIFVHGGHTSRVYDFDWNPNDSYPLMICSVSDDNVVQMWQMSSKFLSSDRN